MFRIRGTGHYLPEHTVLSSDLDAKYGHPSGTFEIASGVRSRHYAGPEESASSMGAKAARAAIENAGLEVSDIDLILGACGTPEQAIPCTAALIQREMGLEDSGVACFDLNSTCLSFVVALRTAEMYVTQGIFKNVVIVSSDIASVGIDYAHLESASLFGDGAAAVVVSRAADGEGSKVLGFGLETYSSGVDTCQIQAGGSRLHPTRLDWQIEKNDPRFLFSMDGPKVYRLASSVLAKFVAKLERLADLPIGRADLVIPHQASAAALELLRRKLDIAPEKLVRILENHGNMIAASIPLALHRAFESGRLKRGSTAYLLGTSAGFTVGGLVLRI